MLKEVLKDASDRMKGAVSVLEEDLVSMRTGRASSGLVEKLMVEYYGMETPLFQLASISVPEPRMIAIKPYDKSTLKAIEKAIQASDLGLTPNNDGTTIRLNIPALTQERREDLRKMVGKRLEEARVAIRNIRRSAIDDVRDMEKEKMISEDEAKRAQDDIQDLTNKYIEQVEAAGERKETEIMEI